MHKNLRVLSLLCVLCFSLSATAQDREEEPRHWAIQAELGQTTMSDDIISGKNFYTGDDEGNAFSVSADYHLSRRFALTGSLYFEQNGIATHYDDGIGLKKVNMAGIMAGGKYYFLPLKWVVQPHVGGAIQTNFLNPGNTKGEGTYELKEAYPGALINMKYDVQCPGVCIVPQFGIDIRLFSTVSFCVDADYRVALWGHNRQNIRFIDGALMGQECLRKTSMSRPCFSFGLRMDFPTKKPTDKFYNTLLWIIRDFIQGKARYRKL